MITIQNVLVATDFGKASETALDYARALARTFGARLHVLHITQNMLLFGGQGAEGIDLAAAQAKIDEAALRQLNALVRDDDRRELGAEAVVRSSGAPDFAIVSFAVEMKADVIVIGTHGRGPLAHLLTGSVAERVVRTAPCPVLTVKHPEHEFVLQDALQLAAKRG